MTLILCYAAGPILHVVEQDHWVTTSYHGGNMMLCDSAFSGRLTPSLEKQVAQIYRPAVKDGILPVTMVPVHKWGE